MAKKKIIVGIVMLIILVGVILFGTYHYKVSSSQSDQLSATSPIPTSASIRPYSRTGSSGNNAGEVDHMGKIMEHLGL